MACNITQLDVGCTAKVIDLAAGASAYRQRLFAFGMLPGVKFKVLRKAPLGCPMQVQVGHNNSFTIRGTESKIITVQPLSSE